MQKCVYKPIKHIGFVNCIWNLITIFVRSFEASAELKGSCFNVILGIVVMIAVLVIVVNIVCYLS